MKVRVTFEYDADFAFALADHYGQKQVTRADVVAWADAVLTASAETIQSDYDGYQKETTEEGTP